VTISRSGFGQVLSVENGLMQVLFCLSIFLIWGTEEIQAPAVDEPIAFTYILFYPVSESTPQIDDDDSAASGLTCSPTVS
jgi:hypothetical protein